MPSPLDALLQPDAATGPTPIPPADELPVDANTQKNNVQLMDAPVPGQGLSVEPGSVPWERPPEFSTEAEAMDFLFEKITRPDVQTDLLRAMDAGVPVAVLVEPILMHGAQEGKWSIDMAMTLLEPFGVILYGLGRKAGITPTIEAPKDTKGKGLDPKPLAEIFKGKIKEKEKALTVDIPETKGLLSRPKGE